MTYKMLDGKPAFRLTTKELEDVISHDLNYSPEFVGQVEKEIDRRDDEIADGTGLPWRIDR